VPRKKRYPETVSIKFISSCKTAKGSPSSCGCVLARQELRKVEKGQSIAELLAFEIAVQSGASLKAMMQHKVELPVGLSQSLDQCKHTTK
jgi:hypothetical protein